MRLYDFPFAPNPKKVRVYLAEKGIPVERVTVNLVKGEHREPAHLARNPMGALPVLELDDGTFLSDSLAIMEYLEEIHPEPDMLGKDPVERARVRALERLADVGVLFRVARIFHNTRSVLPGAVPEPAIAKTMMGELPRPLSALDEMMGDAPFLAGDRPTLADCSLFAAYTMARMGEIELPRFERLDAWFERFSARPSAEA